MEAKQEHERTQQEQARRDAETRRRQQEEENRRAAEQRAGIVAGVAYRSEGIDPFDVLDVAAERETGLHRGRQPTEGQLAALKKFKIELPPDGTFSDARRLLGAAVARARAGLATYPQLKQLKKHGCPNADHLTFPEAGRRLDELARNGWKRPASWD
jgi:hypothetical protein